jgi:multidrug efflux pump subunit AcrA (membrane-fusion protein)
MSHKENILVSSNGSHKATGKKRYLELHSEEVRDIMGKVPGRTLQWGSTFMLLVIFGLLILAWFIRYPNIITGSVILTTHNPPIEIVNKVNGKIRELYKRESDMVAGNSYLAEIESTLSREDILYLQETNRRIKIFLSRPDQRVTFIENKIVGDVQPEYNKLLDLIIEYEHFLDDDYYSHTLQFLKNEIAGYTHLDTLTTRQLTLSQKEFSNAEEKLNGQMHLLKENVISKHDFIQEENVFIRQGKEFQNLKKTLIQNGILINERKKELDRLMHERKEKERSLRLEINKSLNNISNLINEWERNYMLTSPIQGMVTYTKSLSVNQFVTSGEPLFVIVPPEEELIGIIHIPIRGSGQVKVGQTVHVRLDGFPTEEFGMLRAEVLSIAAVPSDKTYRLIITLKNGMKSSYGKEIPFKPEMTGIAEIITQDLRLAERVFLRLKGLFDN